MKMTLLSRFSSLFCISLCIATTACDADLGDANDTDGADAGSSADGSDSASNSDSNSDSDSGGGPSLICDAEAPCPDGQFCFNGLCALGCTNDDNCADNQFCDTDLLLCQNTAVATCVDEDECLGEQICISGLCSTPPEQTGCNPTSPEDGCASDAVCLFDDVDSESTSCYTMPACAEDDSCPTGIGGAVCNLGYLPNKDKVCLLGLCEDTSHCPTDWSCVRPSGNSVLGLCSDGSLGSVCTSPDECTSGVCNAIPGAPGFCS